MEVVSKEIDVEGVKLRVVAEYTTSASASEVASLNIVSVFIGETDVADLLEAHMYTIATTMLRLLQYGC